MSAPASKRAKPDDDSTTLGALLKKSLEEGKANGNISASSNETMELSQSSIESKQKQQELLAHVEAMRRARTITVPTNDTMVQIKLRELGHPITLFGEAAPGRRERLRAVLARLAVEGKLVNAQIEKQREEEEAKRENKPLLYEGPKQLLEIRKKILEFSIKRAKIRVGEQRRKRERPEPGEEEQEVFKTQKAERKLQRYVNLSSEIGDNRPISSIHFAPDSKRIVTASWGGLCKVWSVPHSEHLCTLRDNDSRISDVNFHPQSGLTQDEKAVNIASCDVNGHVYLWPLKKDLTPGDDVPQIDPIACLKGHKARCSRLVFHPQGDHLISAAFDNTWRLWDLETQKQVLIQRGHSRPVYGVACHGDGSLLASGDLGGNCRLWDLRSGKALMSLRGHSKQIICADFNPNGYYLATGGSDHTVRIWDLRRKDCVYTIPAHNKLISNCRWQPHNGYSLVTSSYDGTAKLWSTQDFQLLKVLAGHESRVMRAEWAPSADYIATASFDRTWKLWDYDDSQAA